MLRASTFAILTLLWTSLHAGGLEKVWELDLKKAVHGVQVQSFKVYKVSFSPDGEQIGVLFSDRVVLFRTHDTSTVLGDFASGVIDLDHFGWSPDGKIFHARGRVVHIGDHNTCDLPRNALRPTFLTNDKLIAFFLNPAKLMPNGQVDLSPPSGAKIRFFDAECHEQDSWEVPATWLIGDATQDRGLLSVWEVKPLAGLIVDPLNRKVLRTESGYDRIAGQFADGGRVICAHACWEVDDGNKISEPPAQAKVVSVAAKSTRLVLEKGGRLAVWDFRTGKEVVSWKRQSITYSFGIDSDGPYWDRRSIPCAISPDGEYIAEGADGKVWLYRVLP